ncbi:ROK family transcriptional regulator [Thalassiella azotivora]
MTTGEDAGRRPPPPRRGGPATTHARRARDVGERADGMRRHNVAALLRAVVARGRTTRVELARLTGLSAPTVTVAVGALLEAGVLRELEPRPGSRGRPAVPLVLDGRRGLVRSVHVGRHEVHVGLVGLDATVVARHVVAHRAPTPEEVVATVSRSVRALEARTPAGARVLRTGVTCGGQVSSETGTVLLHAGLGWRDVRLAAAVGAAVPEPVVLEQSIRAAAGYELLFGYGRSADDFALLHVGTGIGVALVQDGRVRTGATASAGSVGHLQVQRGPRAPQCPCGRRGCFQVVAGDDAVVQRVRADGLDVGGVDDVVEAARSGRAAAVEALRSRAQAVATAAAALVDLYDPGALVLRGSITRLHEHQVDVLCRELDRLAHLPDAGSRVVVGDRSGDSEVLVAAAPAIAAVLDDPFAGA